jgi:putative transposase
MRERLYTEIALEALNMAIERQRPAPDLIHHSDRGHPVRRRSLSAGASPLPLYPSMSGKGNSLDNAPIESFFHTLKTERVHHRVYGTRAEARRDLFHYIEGFYNPCRLHSAPGYTNPARAEKLAA